MPSRLKLVLAISAAKSRAASGKGKLRVSHASGIRGRAARAIIAGTITLFLAPQPGKARQIPPEETQALQARLAAVAAPDGAQLAKALGVEPASKEPPPDLAQNYLQDLGNLDGRRTSEYLLEWLAGEESAAAEVASPEWSLFLLDWDGGRWQALPLMSGYAPFTVQVLPRMNSRQRLIAVTVFAGQTRIPYPAIFRFHNHSAGLLWDGRSDESRYEGHNQGHVQFRVEQGVLQMVADGRADPGLLVFSKTGSRGFAAQSTYHWTGNAFDPVKTEYTANRDFTLYRFIAALHLRDFRTAYSLIDPAKFLETDKPTPEAFRKMMQDQFPEFLDARIFKAPESGAAENTFQLNLEDKVYVYTPSFSGGPPFLLTGLGRQEHKPEAE